MFHIHLLFLFVYLVTADVEVGFSFAEQLPNVARVDEPYSFTMANTTYKSTNYEAITYEAGQLPDWLSFDSGSRTFTGTPSKTDVGTFEVEIIGSDSSNSLSQNYSMIVSNDTGLELSASNVMFVEISEYGKTNGVDGLVVSEGQEINIKFTKDVFKSKTDSNRPITAYYGRSADRSSLPNWISFNSDDLSFSGTVPHVTSKNAPSFEYGFSFIGSDYYGYAGAEGNFKIVVGGHQLSTNINETIKVNGTYNDEFDLEIPILKNVFLDNQPITRENISSVEASNLPDYIKFDDEKFTLTGNFPNDSTFDNFSINVFDIYSNEVELPYSFDSMGSVFTVKSLPAVNATRGKWFEYSLMNSYFTDANETTVDPDYDADWLDYHTSNKTFNGMTPDDFKSLSVKVKASSDFDTETKSFQIKGIKAKSKSSSSSESHSKTQSSSSSSTSSASASSSAAAAVAANDKKKEGGWDTRKKLAVGLGAGIPALLILIAAIILICCCVKRRKNNDEESKSGDTTLDDEDKEITGPGFGKIDGTPYTNDPKVLAATNVKHLDKDNMSTSSSLTHVENDSDASQYYDANGLDYDGDKPTKSWRANDNSDIAKDYTTGLTKNGDIRKSTASLSTVNTEQLFSVRLVEDQSIIRGSQQSSFGSGQFMSNNSLNALLNRDDSGNFQRLDSDGNIVDKSQSLNSSPRKMSRSPSALGILVEKPNESAKDISSDYTSTRSETQSKNSLYDDFKATQTEQGDYDWVDSKDTYKFLNNGQAINMSISDNSIVTNPHQENDVNNPRISTTSLGKTAKLVDFTRRSSLRESQQNLSYHYQGEVAQIHDDQDSL